MDLRKMDIEMGDESLNDDQAQQDSQLNHNACNTQSDVDMEDVDAQDAQSDGNSAPGVPVTVQPQGSFAVTVTRPGLEQTLLSNPAAGLINLQVLQTPNKADTSSLPPTQDINNSINSTHPEQNSGTPDTGTVGAQTFIPNSGSPLPQDRTPTQPTAETPAQSQNIKPLTSKHTNNNDDTADTQAMEASAPRDEGIIYIYMDLSKYSSETAKNFIHKTKLEKALQSWANGKPLGLQETFSITQVNKPDNTSVELKITPSSAVQKILKLQSAELKFKDHDEKVNVEFFQDKPEPRETKTTKQESVPTERKPSVPDLQRDFANVSAINVSAPDFTIPLYQFWYLNQAYRPELGQIEKKFGVDIKAEVSVTISAKHKDMTGDSVEKAKKMFSDLYQDAAPNIKCVHVSQEQGRVINELLRDVTDTERQRCVMQTCGNNYMLLAPEPITTKIEKVQGSETFSHMEIGPASILASRNSMYTNSTIEFDIKKAPVSLEMAETQWTLMQMIYSQQISQIENRYDVKFNSKSSQALVEVMARSNGKYQCNLETHAIRALTHLYQKIATTTVSCYMKDLSDQKMASEMQTILHKYPVIKETYLGTWRLVGLPQHVVHAIDDIENKLNCSVFDKETKKTLGSPKDYPFPQHGGEVVFGFANKATGVNGDAHQKQNKEDEEDKCPICLDSITNKKELKCGHGFCNDCLDQSVKSIGKICPLCKEVFGILIGNQPSGNMNIKFNEYTKLPGYSNCGTIEISYSIPGGFQTHEHPHPGKPYHGTSRTAYLPNNDEGKHVLGLLRKAFNQKLIFTVGTSRTTGQDDAVIWNDVHHKTSIGGGPQCFGYPDPDYLKRVKDELKAKGIV